MNAVAYLPAEPVAAPRAKRPRTRWLLTVNIVALLCVAVFLRVWQIDRLPGINGDEAWSGVQVMRCLQGESIDWTTPSGNPINVFFLAPLAALHAVFSPSFALLRSVALVSGLLALVANYFLCRKAFDKPTAVISTVLLALMPINIAYSRFAWDTGQTLLATLFVLYLPLLRMRSAEQGRSLSLGAMLALAAAILVHPTNVFAAPLVFVPPLYARRGQLGDALLNRVFSAGKWQLAAIVGVTAAISYLAWPWLSATVPERGFAAAGQFLRNYFDLLSGDTTYRYISGADVGAPGLPWAAWIGPVSTLVFGMVFAAAVWGLIRQAQLRPSNADTSVVIGWLVMGLGFFMVAGPRAIAPHFERYGLCLIAPAVLVVSRGLAWWMEAWQPRRQLALASMSLLAWLWALAFYGGYFDFIEQTGGRSHRAFRTAAVEPKLAAYRLVLENRDPRHSTNIVCHEWWNYWPIAYLASAQKHVHVYTWDEWRALCANQKSVSLGDAWFVEFAGSEGEREIESLLGSGPRIPRKQFVADAEGQPFLTVFTQSEKYLQNY